MRCTACGFELTGFERFCESCGTPVQTSAHSRSGPAPGSPVGPPPGAPPMSTPPDPRGAPAAPAAPRRKVGTRLVVGLMAFVLVAGAGVVVATNRNRIPGLASQTKVRQAFMGGFFAASADQVLHARIEGDPSEQWSWSASGTVNTMHIDGDTAFVLDADDKGSQVVALDTANGDPRWTVDVGDGTVYGSIVPLGSVVIVTTYESSSSSSGVTRVAALQRGDGSQVWEKDVGDGYSMAYALEADLLLASGETGGDLDLARVDPATGANRWSKAIADDDDVQVGRETLYVSERDDLVAYDLGTGEQRWSISADNTGMIAEVGDVVVVAPPADDGNVQAYATSDGSRRWDKAVADDDISGLDVLDDARVLVRAGDRVHVVKVEDGTEAWDLSADSLYVTGDIVVGASSKDDSTRVSTVAAADGKEVSSARLSSGSVHALGQDVVYALDDDHVVAYDTTKEKGGERLWRFRIGSRRTSGTTRPSSSSSTSGSSSGVVVRPVDGGLILSDGRDVKRIG